VGLKRCGIDGVLVGQLQVGSDGRSAHLDHLVGLKSNFQCLLLLNGHWHAQLLHSFK
jgi:hypothetical protein